MVLGQLMFFALLCFLVSGSERAVYKLTLISTVSPNERTGNAECPIQPFTVSHSMISFQLDQYYHSRLFKKSSITQTGNDSMIIIHSQSNEKYMAYMDYKLGLHKNPLLTPYLQCNESETIGVILYI